MGGTVKIGVSNHFHLVLRSRPDVVATWDDTEVAQRWWTLCPKRKVKQEIDGQSTWIPAEATEWDLNSIRNDPVLLAAIRLRLSDISWWMRLLCQTIALRANGEEGKRGSTPAEASAIFERLGIDGVACSKVVKDFGRAFKNVAGKSTSIERARSLKTGRKFYRVRV